MYVETLYQLNDMKMADLYTLEMIYVKGRDFSSMIVYTHVLVKVRKGHIQMKSEMKSLTK